MKPVAYVMAVILGLLGLLFVVGWQGYWPRLVIGIVLLGATAAIVWLARMRPKPSNTTIVQKIDLSGDVHLENLTCKACGATLGPKSVSVQAGAVFVRCEFCQAAYQLEEEPKW